MIQKLLKLDKQNGITKSEMIEIVTRLAFYFVWNKAYSTLNLI